MADAEMPATLLDDLADLDPATRRELAEQLCNVAETFADVPQRSAHRLHAWAVGPLARLP